ncbi:hypothetical protein [Candidatus Nitrosotenuis cloacae]|uniref:hypothetical protein n=1 Tax=Candidatus Nitrosotenuis cloacae TaxID=1603555 RepID=UPI00228193B9|nr:hypothetical protein [Candidatus Nitrosotenuis cloacae]
MKILRELCLKTLLIAMALCLTILGNLILTSAQEVEVNLTVSLAPSSLETGENTHKIGHVGFAKGDSLIKLSKDTTINLESDNPDVASVPPHVTIPAGAQSATFEIKTTSTPGTAKIFASFEDEIDFDILTVGGNHEDIENDLNLVVNIPTGEMNVNSEMPFSFYLQNSNGDITQAPFDIDISLEYEENLIKVEIEDPTIRKGNSYVLGTIKSSDKVGNAFIRASADKLGFDEAREIKISSSLPASLSVQIFPDKVPATLKRDIDIIVSLIDSDGLPTLAQNDVQLQFFSDDQSIGDQIDRTIKESQLSGIIKKGEFSYHFKQKVDIYKENKTIGVGATTKGLGVAMDTFETVKPITTNNPAVVNKTMQVYTLDKIPTKSSTIAVFQIGTLFAKQADDTEQESTDAEKEFFPLIVNENYDSVGSDQKIGLISSNDLLLKIQQIGKIDATSSYGTAVVGTGQETGTVVLSSTIKGIGAASTQTEVINTLKQEKTMIFSPTGANSILFDKNGYFDLFIISLDSKGRPTTVENTIRYLVTPINEILAIEKGRTYSHVTFLGNSIQSEGQESLAIKTIPIGESADPSLETENVFEKEPTARLGIITPYKVLNPDNMRHTGIVQLYDFRDNPITLSEDLRVKLNPSEIGIIDVPDYVMIPKGHSYAEFPIDTKGKEGEMKLGATAKGIVSATADITTKSPVTKLKVSIGSVNEPLLVDQPTELKIYVDDEEQNSVGGVTLRVVSTNSTISPNVITTSDDGSAIIKLSATQAPKMSLQILASAEGFTGEQKTFEFQVKSTVDESKTELPGWVIYAGIGAVVAIGAGMFFGLRKPKKQEDEDEMYE